MMEFDFSDNRPVMIAGPTASGKSALALDIAQRFGGVVVNADALQVYDGWRILTARPGPEDTARVAHHLYGHVPRDRPYSVGHWLRDLAPHLEGPRPIIVGGTGLYFSALTEGLAEIPATPPQVRARADAMPLQQMIADLTPDTAATIDLANRARVQRAWEVQSATGRALPDWHKAPAAPLLPLAQAHPVLLMPERDWLNARIERRFDMMMDEGLQNEAQRMAAMFDPAHPSSKAIGAQAAVQFAEGRIDRDRLRETVVIGTRQYAKRQRTWFRGRFKAWRAIDPSTLG